MGTGYTRNDTSNNIADGNIINAADLDGEFDAIESAMGTGGHTHDGTSAEGGPVTVLGPVQDFVASATEIKPKTTNTLDIGTNSLLFKDMFLDGVATVGSIKIDNAGTIGSASDADAIAISSGGVVSFSQNTIGKTGSGYVLSLQTSDTTIEATNVLGKIEFSAPDEASGTDAILVGASIEALAEGTFSSSVNSTALVFKTNTTGAATERMRLTSAGDLHFLDSRKAIFGAGSDLQIYHDGSNSFISESNATGSLFINASNLVLRNTSGEYYFYGNSDGAVNLYYDNASKLATTSTGIDVTGTVTADGLTVDGNVLINGTTAPLTVNTTGNNQIRLQGSGTAFGQAYGTTGIDWGFTDDTGTLNRLVIADNGDISFYEDTGTTAKFFWDASAERLGIGNSAPASALDVTGTVTADGLTVDGSATEVKFTTSAGRMDLFLTDTDTTDGQVRVRGDANSLSLITDTKLRQTISSGGDISFYEDTGTTAKFFWDASAESLGIGTSSPAAKVTIAKDLSGPLDATAFRLNASSTNDSNTLFGGPVSSGNYSFFQSYKEGTSAGVRALALNPSGGNVGIGTSSPDQTLHVFKGNAGAVSSASNAVITIENSSDASLQFLTPNNVANQIRFGDVQDNGSGIIEYNHSNAYMSFATNGPERMRIDSSGNLLVGKTATGLANQGAEFSSTGQVKGTAPNQVVGYFNRTSSDGDILEFRKDNATVGSIGSNSSGGQPLLDINAKTTGSSQMRFTTSGSEAMRIDSSGNVLVGTTSVGGIDGVSLNGFGYIYGNRAGGVSGYFDRGTSDGDIVEFRKDGAPVGSIGAISDGIYIGNGQEGIRFDQSLNAIIPCTATGGGYDNHVTLGADNPRFKDLYLSGGVYLGGTGAANKLDSYEEGTWTPSYGGTGADPTATYLSQTSGHYTKIGDLVHCQVEVRTSAISGGSGELEIKGFPFTANGLSELAQGAVTLYNITFNTSYLYTFEMQSSTTYGFVRVSRSGTSSTNLAVADVLNSNPALIRFTVSYKVA